MRVLTQVLPLTSYWRLFEITQALLMLFAAAGISAICMTNRLLRQFKGRFVGQLHSLAGQVESARRIAQTIRDREPCATPPSARSDPPSDPPTPPVDTYAETRRDRPRWPAHEPSAAGRAAALGSECLAHAGAARAAPEARAKAFVFALPPDAAYLGTPGLPGLHPMQAHAECSGHTHNRVVKELFPRTEGPGWGPVGDHAFSVARDPAERTAMEAAEQVRALLCSLPPLCTLPSVRIGPCSTSIRRRSALTGMYEVLKADRFTTITLHGNRAQRSTRWRVRVCATQGS